MPCRESFPLEKMLHMVLLTKIPRKKSVQKKKNQKYNLKTKNKHYCKTNIFLALLGIWNAVHTSEETKPCTVCTVNSFRKKRVSRKKKTFKPTEAKSGYFNNIIARRTLMRILCTWRNVCAIVYFHNNNFNTAAAVKHKYLLYNVIM